MDHSKIATAEDFLAMLDEVDDLVVLLRSHQAAARVRAKLEVRDGYPTRSMPESDIAGGRTGDPTADFVVSKAGGRLDDEGMAITDDHWREFQDPIKASVRRMDTVVLDARNRLREAISALAVALPNGLPESVREVCKTCGINRKVAKRWIKESAQCGPCYERSRRRRASQPASTVAS